MVIDRSGPGDYVSGMPIRDLRPSELPAATRLLVSAFEDDPALRWLLPDPAVRASAAPLLAEGWLRYALRWGRVWCTDGLEAVAVRRPPGAEHLHLWGLIWAGLWRLPLLLGVAGTFRLLAGGAAADARHHAAVQGPHWYCWLLAVHPDHRGRGHAGELVAHTFAQADADGVPCYLESTNPRSVAMHRHHGWRVAATSRDGGLQVWSMVRAKADEDGPVPATQPSFLPKSVASACDTMVSR